MEDAEYEVCVKTAYDRVAAKLESLQDLALIHAHERRRNPLMIEVCPECNAQEDLNLANPRLHERCRFYDCPIKQARQGG